MTAVESRLLWVRRHRKWLGAGALSIAVVVIAVLIILPGNGLTNWLTSD